MKAYLIFEDGEVFEGERIGQPCDVSGEVVFCTNMVGYMEMLTDPACHGLIVLFTFPMVGNYGAISADAESGKVFAAGVIVKEMCEIGSNFRKDSELSEYLAKNGIGGICGVDTRAITKKIREAGTLRAMICDNADGIKEKVNALYLQRLKDVSAAVSTKEVSISGSGRKVVLWDFGCKNALTRELVKRGCEVIKVPYSYTAEQILSYNPEGIIIAGGGGDPNDNKKEVEELKHLIAEEIPMMGINMGHAMLCLAGGGKVKKLRCGHRGSQCIRDTKTSELYITAQNHAYSTVVSSLDKNKMTVRYINLNDRSCEGVDFVDLPIFGIQFSPEASAGPQDAGVMFDRFLTLLDEVKYDA